MAQLTQFLWILLFSFLGEIVHALLPLPIPASVYGLTLLFLALCLRVVRLEQVKGASAFLIQIMPLLFVPPLVGLMDAWEVLRPVLLPAAVIVVVVTLLVLLVSGAVAQAVLGWTDKKEKKVGK